MLVLAKCGGIGNQLLEQLEPTPFQHYKHVLKVIMVFNISRHNFYLI